MRSSAGARPEADPGTLTAVPLARRQRLLSFERRTRVWLVLAILASLLPSAILLQRFTGSTTRTAEFVILLAASYALAAEIFYHQLIRPLQTLTNIVAAIREEDYSFRARGARRGDTIGDLALEINSLSAALQTQRAAAQDALSLLERILTSMHSPVLAFDDTGRLRLLNPAALNALRLGPPEPIGRTASELQLNTLLTLPDQGIYPPAEDVNVNQTELLTSRTARWSVRRAAFRLHGVPHTLLVLSDVAAVLREEERLAWQRLIRVLSHEINNSLTPIQSIAGSLRDRSAALEEEDRQDFERGLSVIEDRAASLNRFLQVYQRLTHLPPPNLQRVRLEDLILRTARLEARLPVSVAAGPSVELTCDPDQLQQALINLVQNAVDAALSPDAQNPGHHPSVAIAWTVDHAEVRCSIEDNGPGIGNPGNLFVPFYTTKPKGSGIGLVLARQIAAAHGGTVTLLSTPQGRGCTAFLTLPRRELPASAVYSQSAGEPS